MLESFFFWEATAFVVLMGVLFVLYPAIQRRKRRSRLAEDSERHPSARKHLDQRYEEGEISREGYLTIKDDTTKTTEEENVR